MSRILCLDYGERRTGVAVSDETRTIAQGLPTICHETEREQMAAIKRIIAEYDVGLIVVGLPASLSGHPSERAEAILQFASRLSKATSLTVTNFDERFTTRMAQRILTEACESGHRRSRSKHVRASRTPAKKEAADRIAATIILEDYLARHERP